MLRWTYRLGAACVCGLALIAWALLHERLAARTKPEFKTARPGYAWSFPRDHGMHPGYRIEWWYYTGHLDARDGRRFGFQFTIFKVETTPWQTGDRFPPVLLIAHSALADESGERLLYHETFQRIFPGMSGNIPDAAEVGLFVERDRLRIDRGGARHRLDFGTKDFRLGLDLSTKLGPVLQGQGGFSPKGPEPENASHYYSLVDLVGSATLSIDGAAIPIESARGWMDHEFSSNFLGDEQRGWDWFWFALDNDVKAMIFRVRSNRGPEHDYYSGTIIEANGNSRALDPGELRIEPLQTWRSPKTGAEYPVRFRVDIGTNRVTTDAWFPAKELNTRVAGVIYWEGPIDVTGTWEGREVRGQGFAEMTGYAESVGKRF